MIVLLLFDEKNLYLYNKKSLIYKYFSLKDF